MNFILIILLKLGMILSSFELDLFNGSDVSLFTKVDNKVKLKKITTETDWAGPTNSVPPQQPMNSANQNLQNTFAIDTEYEILQIDSSTPSIKLNNIGQNTVLDPNLSSLNLDAYTDENGVAIYNIGGIIKYTDIAGS